jgi:TonB family protein
VALPRAIGVDEEPLALRSRGPTINLFADSTDMWFEEASVIVDRTVILCIALISSMTAFAQDIKKITKNAAVEAATYKPIAQYPGLAQQLKIEGTVDVEVVIAETGTVEKVNIVSGNPVLTKTAAETVKKWKFRPFLDEGKPTKVLASLSFVFKRP